MPKSGPNKRRQFTCSVCGIDFESGRSPNKGNLPRCPKCLQAAAYQRAKAANYWKQDKYRKYGQRWRLKAYYGLTAEQYEELADQQGNVCAICKQTNTKKGRSTRLVVDHDHDTGKIRGLLCDHCNRALGLLKDSTVALESALAYLRKHNDSSKLG